MTRDGKFLCSSKDIFTELIPQYYTFRDEFEGLSNEQEWG